MFHIWLCNIYYVVLHLRIEHKSNGEQMKAKIKTKSNYKNLNGQWLEVKEIVGTRVSCLWFSEEFQKTITIDFSLNEVSEIIT